MYILSRRAAILLLLFASSAINTLFCQVMSLGVLYFDTHSSQQSAMPQEELQALTLALSEMMISDLSTLQMLTLVEREEINRIVEEQQLGLTGLLDETSTAQAGKLLGARFLMTGKALFTEQLVTLSSRITEVESGEIVSSVTLNGTAENLFILQEALLEELINQWDIPLSRSEKERLSQRDNISLKGLLEFGKGLRASDRGDLEEARIWLQSAVEINPDFTLAGNLLNAIEERFDSYIINRETELPREILDRIDDLAEGDSKAEQEVLQMYWAYLQPMMTALSYYGSWASLEKETREWFFQETIKPGWAQMGLPEEPENMEQLENYLGRRIYKAQQILEYLLAKDLPLEGFNSYMHPIEGMTGYFLTLFASLSSMAQWQIPPMINTEGEKVAGMEEYYDILLRYCDMFISNFPYSAYGSIVTPMMQTLLEHR